MPNLEITAPHSHSLMTLLPGQTNEYTPQPQGRLSARIAPCQIDWPRSYKVIDPIHQGERLSLKSRVIKKLDHLADHPGEVLYQWLPTIAKCSLGIIAIGATAGTATGAYFGILALKSAFSLAHPWIAGALGVAV